MNTLKTRIKFRKDTEANFISVGNTLVLLDGEIIIVETLAQGLRIKVGDGHSTYNQLPFADENLIALINNVIVRGYYFNGEFYADERHTERYVPYVNKLYIDNPTHSIYCWDEEIKKYFLAISVPTATKDTAGIMKLYDELGTAVDGTITQKCTTEEINKKFEVYAEADETLVFI